MSEALQNTETAPKNVYEDGDSSLDQEAERLRTYDVPTGASIEVIGELKEGQLLLDIGSGENPGLCEFVQDNNAKYMAVDFRPEPLIAQREKGAFAVRADARFLPVAEAIADISHCRFVLAHFPDKESRQRIVSEALRALAPGGKAVFMDYDWTALDGSPAIQKLRDFTLDNIKGFDAGYGAKAKAEIAEFIGDEVELEERRIALPLMHDYGPALSIRQVTVQQLKNQDESQELIREAKEIFDAIKEEAASEKPPGYHMPDMVAIVVSKPLDTK